MSKIVVVFEVAGFTQKNYDAIMAELKASEKLYHEDRPVHISFQKGGSWCVVDVWRSAEAFMKFGENTLGPIFAKLGIAPPQPGIYPMHNYVGKKAGDMVFA